MQSAVDHDAQLAVFGGPSPFPEKELMIYMILQAIEDLKGADKGKFREETLAWFTTHDEKHWFLSFENICEQLDIDVDTVRRRILAQYG